MKTTTLLLTLAAVHAFGGNPSLQPCKDPTGGRPFSERWRVVTDLDGDGVNDLILSGGPAAFGNASGLWTVYLNRKGDYLRVGEISAHPGAITIEPDHGRNHQRPEEKYHARVWVYLRGSASEGQFGYYRIGEKAIDELRHFEIYPSDGGTSLGNAIYAAAFESDSPIEFSLERSTTDADGTVHWKEEER